MLLYEMSKNQIGHITKMQMTKEEKCRLYQLGIYEGGILQMEHKGRKKHPCVFYVRGNFLMLRYDVMKRIEVEG